MPRINPVANPNAETAEALSKTVLGEGPVLNVFTTLAHNLKLLKRLNVLGGYFIGRGRLSGRDREIVILRSAWRAGSGYEFGQHTLLGGGAGLSDLENLRVAKGSPQCGPSEAALIAMVDELDSKVVVSDTTWKALEQKYDNDQLLEVLLLAGFYRMLAGLLNTVGVELDEGVPGWPAGSEPST